jgi:hypothetical protein
MHVRKQARFHFFKKKKEQNVNIEENKIAVNSKVPGELCWKLRAARVSPFFFCFLLLFPD